jgi:hypothetical protein
MAFLNQEYKYRCDGTKINNVHEAKVFLLSFVLYEGRYLVCPHRELFDAAKPLMTDTTIWELLQGEGIRQVTFSAGTCTPLPANLTCTIVY